ncbi:hypothetical protein PLICRDRAFT_33064 [Plicaturopsis crispa FD-325 SS-3]|uniref:Uncharacterized protein n=1 Tax=Plicaturopsis crispa FD-325 SS-3 TaxID=944288 RepID=A0A0C9SVL6_PLICR|nr:hypothetical protein PLICRDRAFT_33064 [Plicaturopsis crispa FD-325 SS-3]
MSEVSVESHPLSSKRRRFAIPHGRDDNGRDEEHAIVVSSDEESKRLAKKRPSQSYRKRGEAQVPASVEPPSVDVENDRKVERNATLRKTIHDLRQEVSELKKSVAKQRENIEDLISCEVCMRTMKIPRVHHVSAVPPINWKLKKFVMQNDGQNEGDNAEDDTGASTNPLAEYFEGLEW